MDPSATPPLRVKNLRGDQHSRDPSPISHASGSTHSRSSSFSRRDSFGSVKEDVDGIAQTFVDSKQSKTGIEKPSSSLTMTLDPMRTPEFCCPCGGFRGWKQIRLGGRRMSRSFSDLRFLGRSSSRGWAWDDDEDERPVEKKKQPKEPEKQRVTIESLPVEVLTQIISYLALDVPPNGYTPRNMDLVSCLLTSRTLHSATLSVLYRNITIPHSVIFSKLLRHLRQYPALGTIVRRLDFSHFTSVGLGRTRQMNAEIQNLTSRTLLDCLELLPNLMELLFQEHVEEDIDTAVIRKVFTDLPNLRAIDFCACASKGFSGRFLDAISTDLPAVLPQLQRVSLHECNSLSPAAFETLLPRLVHLTHLDVAHTQITESALFSIPESARITHLNLARCTRLTGPQVVRFLTTHPAVTESLVYLNLMADPSRYRLLEAEDVTELLPKLPSTLRSLNLNGARIRSEHAPLLLPLTKHLEELGLSNAELTTDDLNSFFIPPEKQGQDQDTATPWQPPALHYLDLSRVSCITLGTLVNPKALVLVSPHSAPLEVLELSDKLIATLRDRTKPGRSNGWTVRELGRRGWYVREPPTGPEGSSRRVDDGSRKWKMGARWWGMRKIPVAVGEVGGLYGHYMFKK
ncbi:hypothetical protein VTN31DRAFT_6027 [Thermomyces dupontii]|uniref:uncharacterized protein n=1 Tax=Talaromyces thermophilus TaxID=28565 RepID=UPI003742073A